MATLQITYGGSSYDVTRLDVIDLIPLSLFLYKTGTNYLKIILQDLIL